jgi:hypothetical protein
MKSRNDITNFKYYIIHSYTLQNTFIKNTFKKNQAYYYYVNQFTNNNGTNNNSMKINRKIKTALLSILGIFLLLFVILVYHIATAKPLDNATIQVSRIDFNKSFDSKSSIDIKQKLHTIPGVKSEIIVKRNIVVYFHDNRIADSKKVYDELMTKGNYDAKRFLLPTNLATKEVCPVMRKDGISYKFSHFIKSIFN